MLVDADTGKRVVEVNYERDDIMLDDGPSTIYSCYQHSC
jgi:hypothetical protein